MMWVIIKHIENKEGVKLPVIILNSDSEIWEFDTEEPVSYTHLTLPTILRV